MNSYDFQEFGALIRNLRPFHFIFFYFFFRLEYFKIGVNYMLMYLHWQFFI